MKATSRNRPTTTVKRLLLALAVSFALFPIAQSAPAPNALGKVMFTEADWEVRVWVDPMSDEKRCTGTLRSNPRVQASTGALMVSFKGKGGVKGYEIRIDDRSKSNMRLPSDIEKELSVVVLDGVEFNEIKESKRIRIQVVPVLSGLLFEDISLNGLQKAVEYIEKSCA